MNIVKFLIGNKDSLEDYFEDIKVNQNPAWIKAGGDHTEFSINFAITGELDDSIDKFEDKIKALFNVENQESIDNISFLNDCATKINQPYQIITSTPQSKFNDNPIMYGFQIRVEEIKE